ncbi:MAG: urea ABC transporter permease subunit UrtB [Gammaproteobacteria bacterium]|nr:urea ABC transporter permease subunit UrtB [Gammaproteobacteria bacterium]
MIKTKLLTLAVFCFWSVISHASNETLEQAFNLLTERSFDDKSQAIKLIAESNHVSSVKLLESILAGDLYYRKKDKRIVYAQKEESKLRIFDALTEEELDLVGKRKVKKIGINNRLRAELKLAISSLALTHPDAEVRLKSVEGMIGKADATMVEKLNGMKAIESDRRILEAISAVIAFSVLADGTREQQLDAIEALQGNLNPAVLSTLRQLGETTESVEVRRAAQKAVKNIESQVDLYGYIETLFFGLSLGSILALAAIGLAITFGVMGVINMAHGELIMIGAYTTYVVQLIMPNAIGLSILVSIPAAFLVSALVGIAIERGVIRFLYGRPLETLLATFGISLVLQQAVRSIFSPLNRSVETPQWMSGSLEINSLLSITYNRLYIFLFCLMVFLVLYLVMKKTSLGLNVRAVSQNRAMARAMGIKSEWVDAMTFGLGSGIAGVAGVALSQITNVGPNLGQAYIVDSFMVVVFGGVGNLWGTLISGLSLGVLGKFLEPVTGAVLAKILVLILIILFIQKRPRGLFPQKGRAAEQ